ncbi:hypothetical protein Plhal304r1_c094g0173021 [Plasmopara halstedii]
MIRARHFFLISVGQVCLCRQAAKRINSFAKVDADLTLRQTNQIKQVMRVMNLRQCTFENEASQ